MNEKKNFFSFIISTLIIFLTILNFTFNVVSGNNSFTTKKEDLEDETYHIPKGFLTYSMTALLLLLLAGVVCWLVRKFFFPQDTTESNAGVSRVKNGVKSDNKSTLEAKEKP